MVRPLRRISRGRGGRVWSARLRASDRVVSVIVLAGPIIGGSDIEIRTECIFRAEPRDLQYLVLGVGGCIRGARQNGIVAERAKAVCIGIARIRRMCVLVSAKKFKVAEVVF